LLVALMPSTWCGLSLRWTHDYDSAIPGPRRRNHLLGLGVRVFVVKGRIKGGFMSTAKFHGPDALRTRLQSREQRSGGPRKTVYILERLGSGFVDVFGQHFGVRPSQFVEHECVVVHGMS